MVDRQLINNSSTLSPRSLGGLLDETFSVFGRHFLRFASLSAIVQMPVGLVTLVLLQYLDGDSYAWDTATFVAAFLIGVFGTLFAYGAAVYAVGQQYVTGKISVRTCYARAWWRVMSLSLLTLGVTATLAVVLAAPTVSDQTRFVLVASLMMVIVVALAIYWSMAVQSVIVEGHKVVGALKRSFVLVRGSWWRVFGITMVLGLVTLGLAILVSIPFAVALTVIGADEGATISNLLLLLADTLVRIVVMPVLFIAGTLLYYDLRVRNEEYDFSKLSQEMGIAAA